MEQGVGGVGSGLVGLHLKDTLIIKSVTISLNWLVLGEAVSPGLARIQMSKHQKYRK